jgi:hypothetical protein
MSYITHSDLGFNRGTPKRGGRKVFNSPVTITVSDAEMKSMTDADLRRKYRDVITRIEEARQYNRPTKDLEVEFCYMYRELEGRQRWRDNTRPEKMNKKFVGRPYRPASNC